MANDIQEIVEDLKSYLEYLKGMGIEALPVSRAKPVPLPTSPLKGEKKGVLPSSLKEKDLTEPPSTGSAPARSSVQTLEEIRREIGDCRRCKLHGTRRTIVFGEGNSEATLMFVGEGPGYDEDVQGMPFVGKAGQLLTKIIQSIKLHREEVYIANIVKCRPPGNRTPESDEIGACSPFVLKQIQAVQPRIICALGAISAQTLLRTAAAISTLRGKWFDFHGIKLIPTFHPAYLLRNPERKKDAWEDMKQIMELIRNSEVKSMANGR